MQHVMIDLETFSTKPTALFPTIAAVQFDYNTGQVGEVFYRRIKIQDAIDKGLSIDASTLEWWMTQRADIMRLMFHDDKNPPVTLSDAMGDLHEWFMKYNLVYPWGNSASFDLGILANGMKVSRVAIPWKFFNERCYRTVTSLVNVDLPKPEDAHNPVSDCKYQIKKLYYANMELNFNKRKDGQTIPKYEWLDGRD